MIRYSRKVSKSLGTAVSIELHGGKERKSLMYEPRKCRALSTHVIKVRSFNFLSGTVGYYCLHGGPPLDFFL